MRELLRKLQDRSWTRLAACAHGVPELWFPERGRAIDRPTAAIAKRICRQDCQVRTECLSEALSTDERFGIWGGLDPKEREELRLERQR